MSTADQPNPLAFEPPAEVKPQTWSYAITEGFKFPDRFVQKCKELARWRGQCAELQSTLDFFVRNLISLADNLEETLAARGETNGTEGSESGLAEAEDPTAAGGPDEAAAAEADDRPPSGESEPPPPSATEETSHESLESACVASAYRTVVSLLENLQIVQVDLVGKTYDTVTHDGRKIEDPFQVIEAEGQGAARQLPVRQVVRSLWVQPAESKIVIVRQGKVCC